MRRIILFFALTMILVIGIACGGESPIPTGTPEPTATFYPTYTPYPTYTRYPTPTLVPTNIPTRASSPTPVPSTPTSLPVVGLDKEVQTDEVVLIVSEARQIESLSWQGQVLKSEGGWVIIYGEARNQTPEEVWLYPHNFVLTSSALNGYIFVDEQATEVVEQQLGIGSIVVGSLGTGIKPGETVPVVVAFNVPEVVGEMTLWVVDAKTGISLGSAGQFSPMWTSTPTVKPTDTPTPLPTRGPGTEIVVLSNHSHYVDDLFGDVYVVGEIRNDTGYSVPPVEIRVDFYNSSGSLVGTAVGFSELLNLPAAEKTCFKADLEDPPDWSRYKFQLPIYELVGEPFAPGLTIFNHAGSYNAESGIYTIIGQVRNEGASRARVAEVIGTLYDTSGTVIGCEWSAVDYIHLDPGQTSFFELPFFDRDYSDAASYRLQVYGEPLEIADPTDPLGPTSATGMGIKRSKVIDALEPLGVKFEPKPGPRGEFYLVGRKGEGLLPDVDVDLIGPADDLLTTRLGVFLSSEFSEAEAMLYLEAFLQAMAPEWEDGMDWVRVNLSKARRGEFLRTAWEDLEIDLWASESSIDVSVGARR